MPLGHPLGPGRSLLHLRSAVPIPISNGRARTRVSSAGIALTAAKKPSVLSVFSSTMAAEKPLINLLRGWPAPAILPADIIRQAADAVLTGTTTGNGDDQWDSITVPTLQYGADPGFEPLREQVAAMLHKVFHQYGAPEDPERICITGGASQSMACIMQSFTDPAYTAGVWIAAPCYHLMCPIFEDAGFAGRLHAVPEDAHGIDLNKLEAAFREAAEKAQPVLYKAQLAETHRKAYRHVVYVVPTSSNPSGKTMNLERRQELVRLARRYDALIVADDVYDFLQWPVVSAESAGSSAAAGVDLPPALPRLVNIDLMLDGGVFANQTNAPFGNAVSNGSFSKMIAPGIRTGWVEGTRAFAFGLAQTGSSKSGGAPSQLCASIVAEMIKSGALDRHLYEIVRPQLQRRHRLLVEAVEEHLGEHVELEVGNVRTAGAGTTFGGYFLWLRLRRDDISADDVADRAMENESLVVAPGSMFHVKGDEKSVPALNHCLRLCFSYEDENRMVEGVQRLARVLQDWDKAPAQKPSDGRAKESMMDTFK